MKLRNGFISNSSSSSFLIAYDPKINWYFRITEALRHLWDISLIIQGYDPADFDSKTDIEIGACKPLSQQSTECLRDRVDEIKRFKKCKKEHPDWMSFVVQDVACYIPTEILDFLETLDTNPDRMFVAEYREGH